MRLHVDLAAIAANAAHVKALAAERGVSVQAVIKQAFARAPLVRACQAGGIADFALSSVSTAQSDAFAGLQRDRLHMIALAKPADSALIMGNFGSSLHSSPYTLPADGSLSAPHHIFIAVRTCDDREGLSSDDEASFDALCGAAQLRGLRITGVLANYGCRIEAAPSPIEFAPVEAVARKLAQRFAEPPKVSLGGSVLIPILEHLPDHDILRVGEAIVAGSIPGVPHAAHLAKPFTLESEILESRPASTNGGAQRILVACGTAVIEPSDISLVDCDGRLAHASGECASFEIAKCSYRVGDTIRLRLGYRSAVRALSNASLELSWGRL